MKRSIAMLLCISFLLTGCSLGDLLSEDGFDLSGILDMLLGADETKPDSGGVSDVLQGNEGSGGGGLSGLLDIFQGDEQPENSPQETVPGTPEHICSWSDPLEGIPEPTYYVIDEEFEMAMALIGVELIPPEDTVDQQIPTDGLWNTQRTNTYDGDLTLDNLQDYLAMYARDADLSALPPVMDLRQRPSAQNRKNRRWTLQITTTCSIPLPTNLRSSWTRM